MYSRGGKFYCGFICHRCGEFLLCINICEGCAGQYCDSCYPEHFVMVCLPRIEREAIKQCTTEEGQYFFSLAGNESGEETKTDRSYAEETHKQKRKRSSAKRL